jgi:hypothetical protein
LSSSSQERIVEAEIFVALFSGHYLEDEVCKREVMTAYRLGKKIVPVVIDAMPGMYRCPAPGVPLSGGDVSTINDLPFSPLDSSYSSFRLFICSSYILHPSYSSISILHLFICSSYIYSSISILHLFICSSWFCIMLIVPLSKLSTRFRRLDESCYLAAVAAL